MKNEYFTMAFGCLLAFMSIAAACTDEDVAQPNRDRLRIAVSTDKAIPSRDIVEGGTLPDGSVIGLSLVDGGGSAYGGTDYGIFTATASTDVVPQVWSLGADVALDNTEGTLYAFYPYSDAVTDIKSVPIKSGSTDYMYAVPVTGLDNANSSADIVMKHALTAVRIKLGRGTYPGAGVVTSVALSGDIADSAVLDATTGILSSVGGAAELDVTPESPVTLSESPTVFTGMVIPTVVTGDLSVSISLDGNPLTATLGDCDLTAGNLLNVNATLNGTELVISSVTLDVWQNTTSIDLSNRESENLLAMYNVTSTTNATRLLNSLTGISKMIIDGVELAPTTSYTFSSTGEHMVEFKLKDEKTIYSSTFGSCKQLIDVYIPNSVTYIEYRAFSDCTGLTEVSIPNSVTSIGQEAFYRCSGLTALDLGDGVQTIGNSAFYGCGGLTGELVIPNSVTSIGQDAFRSCSGLTALDLGDGVQTIGDYAFYGCGGLYSIVSRATIAPAIQSNTFANVKKGGILTIPTSATDYGVWMGTDSYYLGYYNWTIQEDFTPTECLSLSITADDVNGRSTSTLIHYTAVCNGVNNLTGEMVNNVCISRTVTSDEFSKNPSTTDSRQLTVSYTYMGVTASTTITQSPYEAAYYTVDLNGEWQNSSVSNPDASLYDGVYESFSNYNVNSTAAAMTIKVKGYETFTIYIRSYAESSFDYVMASQLDQSIDNNTSYSDNTLVKGHTCNTQNSGTTLGNYTALTYTLPDTETEHTITVLYHKDGSSHSGTDKGYLLIGKP